MVLGSEIRKRSFLEQLVGMMILDDPRIDIVYLSSEGRRCELCGGEIQDKATAFKWEEQRGNTFYLGMWFLHYNCYNLLLYGND